MRVWNGFGDWWRRLPVARRRTAALIGALVLTGIAALGVVSESARGVLGIVVRYGSLALVVYLAFNLVLRSSRGPSAFDGAGEEFHGPSARAAIILMVAIIAAVAFNWVGASWASNQIYGSESPMPSGLVIPGGVR